jgi:histidine triad (HIT) family protein
MSDASRESSSTVLTYDPYNVFAQIIHGKIACHKVYEDDEAIVFMDLLPQSPGHAQVVPKAPSRNLMDADPAVLAKLLPLIQKVAIAARAAFAADGVSIAQLNEHASGQTIYHLHFHVIPRFEGVELKTRANRSMEDEAVLAANAEKLKAAMAAGA